MSKAQKKKGPRHMRTRGAVCGCCLLKSAGLIRISNCMLGRIQRFHHFGYSLDNSSLPTAICNACRAKLLRLHQDPNGVNNLAKVKYDKLLGPRPPTRHTFDQPCGCSVCQLARKTLHWEFKNLLDQYIEAPTPTPCLTPDAVKICTYCHSQIGRGLCHACSRSQFRENVADLVKEKSEKTRGRVVSSLLKDVFEEQSIDTRGGTVELPTGGRLLKITLQD